MNSTGFCVRQNIDPNMFYIIKVAFQGYIAEQSDWSKKKKNFSYFLKLSVCFKEMSNIVNVEIHRSDPIALKLTGLQSA